MEKAAFSGVRAMRSGEEWRQRPAGLCDERRQTSRRRGRVYDVKAAVTAPAALTVAKATTFVSEATPSRPR